MKRSSLFVFLYLFTDASSSRIVARLIEAGYRRELEFLERVCQKRKYDAGFPLFHKHPLVNRPSLLSDGCELFVLGGGFLLKSCSSLEADFAGDASVYDDRAGLSVCQDQACDSS